MDEASRDRLLGALNALPEEELKGVIALVARAGYIERVNKVLGEVERELDASFQPSMAMAAMMVILAFQTETNEAYYSNDEVAKALYDRFRDLLRTVVGRR